MILSINSGSSSIKFALFKAGNPLEQVIHGEIENIGTKKATLNYNSATSQQKDHSKIEAPDHEQAAKHLIDCKIIIPPPPLL